jgi:IS5 family transposase
MMVTWSTPRNLTKARQTPREEWTMRTKSTSQAYLEIQLPSSTTKEVRQYCEKYRALDTILSDNPVLLDLAHADFVLRLSESEDGREGRYTSEELLRGVVVMFVEADSYRDSVVRIETSEFLRNFLKLGFYKPMPSFSFMCKAFSAVSEATWQAMNGVLGQYARKEEKITGERLRVDTTAYESNIHYPTDSSLLWDSYRVLARQLKELQRSHPELHLNHRYHTKKIKKLAQSISRNAGSKSGSKQRAVKGWYQTLLERVRRIVEIGKEVLVLPISSLLDTFTLDHFVPLVERVIDQADRRIFQGEVVPADEKLYSIFEEHVELLIRGKAGKRVEFGHMVAVAQTGEKFISYFESLPHREADTTLLPACLEAHRALFEANPSLLTGDKGFYKDMKQIAALEKDIKTVSICKKGKLTEEQHAREHSKEFQKGQRFRAGVEGTISVLKRVFKLNLCRFKGIKHFAASVGCAVFCYNLVLLTRL